MSDQRDGSNLIPLHPVPPDAPLGEMPRRAALQALLTGATTAFVLPVALEAQHPIQHHLLDSGAIELAQRRAAAAASTPVFLDAHQSRTLAALAEAIVPGSTAARVGPFIDQLLAVDSGANQRAFVGALGAFDMLAINRHGKAWTGLSAAQQDALLGEASTGDAKVSPLQAHFQNLKEWIAGAYYSSAPGMRELGWTGIVVHGELPGCTHPGGHQD